MLKTCQAKLNIKLRHTYIDIEKKKNKKFVKILNSFCSLNIFRRNL